MALQILQKYERQRSVLCGESTLTRESHKFAFVVDSNRHTRSKHHTIHCFTFYLGEFHIPIAEITFPFISYAATEFMHDVKMKVCPKFVHLFLRATRHVFSEIFPLASAVHSWCTSESGGETELFQSSREKKTETNECIRRLRRKRANQHLGIWRCMDNSPVRRIFPR